MNRNVEEGIQRDAQEKEEKKSSFTVSDRRHWALQAAPEVGAPPVEKPRLPTYLERLKAELEGKDRKLREFISNMERENVSFRERLHRELERRVEKERSETILEFLPVMDSLERAVAVVDKHGNNADLLEGLRLVCGQFLGQLKKIGVEPLKVIGEPFDPSMSEGLGIVPTRDPKEDNLVVDELEKGYTLNGKLLRPARVRVRKLVAENEQS